MSTLLFFVGRGNPGPGLAVACLNLIVAVALVCVSLLLGLTVALLAWLHAFATGDAQPIRRGAERTAVA